MIIALKMGATRVKSKSDSQQVANQVSNQYQAKEPQLIKYLQKVQSLSSCSLSFEVEHIPHEQNFRANLLSKLATLKTAVRTRFGSTSIHWVLMIIFYLYGKNFGTLMVCYYVALTPSFDSEYMTYNVTNFLILCSNSASMSVIRSSKRCSKLLLQWSFCLCTDSLLRSFWEDVMLMMQRSLILCFWMWLWSISFWRMASFWSYVI